MMDNTKPDLLQSAKLITYRYMRSLPHRAIFSDSDEVFSAALLVVTELNKTWNPAKSKWSTYLKLYGTRRLSRDMMQHIYWTKRRQVEDKTTLCPATFLWDIEELKNTSHLGRYNGFDEVDNRDEVN